MTHHEIISADQHVEALALVDVAHADALAALDAADRYGVQLDQLTTGRELVTELGPTTNVYADRSQRLAHVVDVNGRRGNEWVDDRCEPGSVGSLGHLGFVNVSSFVYAGNDGNDPSATSEATHVEVPCVSWGDYAGSTVERSNQRVLLANYPDTFVELRSDYCYSTLVLPLDAWVPAELVAELVGLAHDYPLLDEMDYSDLETELEDESWESFGRWDLRREVVTQLELLDVDDTLDADDVVDTLDDDALDVAWWDHRNNGNGDETFCEDAVSACFRTDTLALELAQELARGAGLLITS